jgi:hypothetical protein
VAVQTMDTVSSYEAKTSVEGPSELQPLVRSLQSILKEIDDEYERERDRISKALPDTEVKDRALAMLKARHRERRENYVRELDSILKRD